MNRGCILPALLVLVASLVRGASASTATRSVEPAGGTQHAVRTLPVTSVPVIGKAMVNMAELARRSDRMTRGSKPRVDRLIENPVEAERDEAIVQPDEAGLAPSAMFRVGRQLGLPSPAPVKSFAGLDDIPMVDSGRVVVPPDANGAVGPARIFQNLKNNVRVIDKSSGAILSTVGVNTFWAASGATPNSYSDPRSTYDPYHGRFITIMLGNLGQTVSNSICLGISDSDDPEGTWHLYRFVVYENSTFALADFPTLGFNRNWIAISVNMYDIPPVIGRRSVFMVHYPTLLNSHSALVYRADSATPDLICGSPCVTCSATCDTEYVVQRQGTSTYSLDRITGAGPGAPTYSVGPALTRPGGEWNGLSSLANYLPQSAPESGASSCASPPCPIERSDDHVRAPAVYRGGSIWFAQQVGLPASAPAYVAVQWTQITAPSGAYVVGGRLQDTLATLSNDRPHYSYPSIAVNANEDFLLGFNRFSTSQHPGAGYAIHLASDGVGSLRDTVIVKDGEDYYRKSSSVSSSRNRWGDFSTSQVDPVDDLTLWTVQEYSKHRVGTDDGNTLTNSSRWGTWWAGVTPANTLTITASSDDNGTITPGGVIPVTPGADQSFTMAAKNGYTFTSLLVDGSPVLPVAIYTFSDVQADHTITAGFSASVGVDQGHPAEFASLLIAPNPGRGRCVIRYTLPRSARIQLSILDLEGRVVTILASGTFEAGAHETPWSGDTPSARAPSGVYFARLQTPVKTFLRRLVLTR